MTASRLFYAAAGLVAAALVSCSSAPKIASHGFDESRFQPIHAMLETAVSNQRISGAVALVSQKDKLHIDCVGFADAESKKPMEPDTIFRIASMTKAITSAAAMILIDDGRLRLSDSVSLYIPEFKGQQVFASDSKDSNGKAIYKTVPAEREVTIHDLLTHTSGIIYGFSADKRELGDLYQLAGVPDGLTQVDATLAERMPLIGKLPLWHQPGKAWTYSLGIDVLGRVIEVASGKSLDQVFQDRVFSPLGMIDTHFFLPGSKLPRLATLYTQGEDKKIKRVGDEPMKLGALTWTSNFHYKGPRTYFSGGAGLVSTAGDYLRFLQMIVNRGELDGHRILRPETVDLMCQNQIGDLNVIFPTHGDKFGYGFGVVSEAGKDKDPSSVGSVSWGGIFYTYFWADPRESVVGILMMQLFPSADLTLTPDFKRMVYEALRPKA